MQTRKSIDPQVFYPSLILILALSVPLALFPEVGEKAVKAVFNFTTGNFGWAFELFGVMCVGFLLWLAFGPYGNVKLGQPEDEPEFPYWSWVAMLFCAGIGIAIVNWAFVEPIYYLSGPPFGVKAMSPEAAEWAGVYGQFHWGITPWAFYALLTFPIGYSVYVRKQPHLTLSTASRGILGDRADGWIGKLLDVVVIFGIVGGVGTSLGLAVPLVSELFSEMLGVENTFGLNIVILLIWTAMFSISVYRGLAKGIRVLSEINMYLAFVLLFFVLAVGPTVFILSMWSNSFGLMVSDFFRLSFYLDPITKGGFPEGWTVFYWAWWIAYGPMMGLFVARISKGRTIRQIVIGELFWGSMGCWLFLAIWGGYTIHVTYNEIVPSVQILNEQGMPAAILSVLKTLPGSKIVLPFYTLLCFIFLATTLDSSAYTLASVSTKELTGEEEPARWNRLFWAFLLAFVGVGLLAVGGLKAVQLSSIIVALPLMPVMVILCLSLMKWLQEDYGEKLIPKTESIVYPDPELSPEPVPAIDMTRAAAVATVLTDK